MNSSAEDISHASMELATAGRSAIISTSSLPQEGYQNTAPRPVQIGQAESTPPTDGGFLPVSVRDVPQKEVEGAPCMSKYASEWVTSVYGPGGAVWTDPIPKDLQKPSVVVGGVDQPVVNCSDAFPKDVYLTTEQASFIAVHGLPAVSKSQWHRVQKTLHKLSNDAGPVRYSTGCVSSLLFVQAGSPYLCGVRVTSILVGTQTKLVPRADEPVPSEFPIGQLHVCVKMWLKAVLMAGILQRAVESGAGVLAELKGPTSRGGVGHRAVHQGQDLMKKANSGLNGNSASKKVRRHPDDLCAVYRLVRAKEGVQSGTPLTTQDHANLRVFTGYYRSGVISLGSIAQCTSIAEVYALVDAAIKPIDGKGALYRVSVDPVPAKCVAQATPSVSSLTSKTISSCEEPPSSRSSAAVPGEKASHLRGSMARVLDLGAGFESEREVAYLARETAVSFVARAGVKAAEVALTNLSTLSFVLSEEIVSAKKRLAAVSAPKEVNPIWLEWVSARLRRYDNDAGCIEWRKETNGSMTARLVAFPSITDSAATGESCLMKLATALLIKLDMLELPEGGELADRWSHLRAYIAVEPDTFGSNVCPE